MHGCEIYLMWENGEVWGDFTLASNLNSDVSFDPCKIWRQLISDLGSALKWFSHSQFVNLDYGWYICQASVHIHAPLVTLFTIVYTLSTKSNQIIRNILTKKMHVWKRNILFVGNETVHRLALFFCSEEDLVLNQDSVISSVFLDSLQF